MTGSDQIPAIAGVVLAGGLSRRMGGGDKSLKELDGATMLARVIERIRPQVTALAINANGDPARFEGYGFDVVGDTVAGYAGPLAGVLAGMQWAQRAAPGAASIVTVATDAPFLPADLVARMLAAQAGHAERIVLAESDGRQHPVFGLWPLALGSDLQAALAAGTRKVLEWTNRHDTVTASFAMLEIGGRTVDPFFNANRPEELREARELISIMRDGPARADTLPQGEVHDL